MNDTFEHLHRSLDITERPVFMVSPLVFGYRHTGFPVPAGHFQVFHRVGQTAFVTGFIIPHQMTVAVKMTFPVVIGTQTAVDGHARKHLLQHTLHMGRPPTVLLDAGIPGAVKPEVLYRRIKGCKLLQLIIRKRQKTAESSAVLGRLHIITPVRVAPVHHREVEMYVNALIVIRLYHFPQKVFLVWGIGYCVFCILTGPEAKAFMVLGSDLHITNSHLLGHLCPLPGIKLNRIPLFHQLQPLARWNFCP